VNWKSRRYKSEHLCKEIVLFKLIHNRSFKIARSGDNSFEACENRLKILERLAQEGIFENVSQLIVKAEKLFSLRFSQIVCSMSNLEKIEIRDRKVQFADLAHFFRSCPKLIKLKLVDMNVDFPMGKFKIVDLNNQLKLGFQRLERVKLKCNVHYDSWRMFLKILT
jgi:hypothetical protein